jgi:imidazolonepropionase-like amidohydrolase
VLSELIEASEVTVIRGGTLVDGTGSAPVDDAVVVVSGSKITAVGSSSEIHIPNRARIIDAVGKTVMPGLIDAHLHVGGWRTDNPLIENLVVPDGVKLLRAGMDAALLLDAGYTTVKDCSGIGAVYIKRAIAEGTLRGPRILAAGYDLTQTFGHGDVFHFLPIETTEARNAHGKWGIFPLICDGVEECMKAARYTLREGADFVKIHTSGGIMSERDRPEHTQFTLEEIAAIVKVAQNAGTFVTAHCQSTEGMRISIEGGVKTIDHAFYPDDEVIEAGKKRNVVFVSTLSIMKRMNDGGVQAGYPEWSVRKSREAWSAVVKNIAKIYRSGATLAAGTDFVGSKLLRLGENALELELLVEHCGLSPMDAIVSATQNGAKACCMEDRIGTLEKGKLADIAIIDGDPLKDIKILQQRERIQMVMKEGSVCIERDRIN